MTESESDTFFTNCSNGTCMGRVIPVRVNTGSYDDILTTGNSMYCPIRTTTDLNGNTYYGCNIYKENIDLAQHINLQDENFVYSCRSKQSMLRESKHYKKEDDYTCTVLVSKLPAKDEKNTDTDIEMFPKTQTQVNNSVVTSVNTTSNVNTPSIASTSSSSKVSNEDFVINIPSKNNFNDANSNEQREMNRQSIENMYQDIEANTKKIKTMLQTEKISPLPRFGFAKFS